MCAEPILEGDEMRRVILVGDEQQSGVELAGRIEPVGVVIGATADHHTAVVLTCGEGDV